jgi:hypothetical protein
MHTHTQTHTHTHRHTHTDTHTHTHTPSIVVESASISAIRCDLGVTNVVICDKDIM